MGRRRLFLLLSLALIISAAHVTTGHAQAAAAVTQLQGGTGGVGRSNSMMRRTTVGSRPPSCAGRCWWCGGRRCVAVQVPITPQDKKIHVHGGRPRKGGGGGASSTSQQRQRQVSTVSSYDDHSNYKPLSWRCKCGGAVVGLNP
ncbi:EPIDERMAL PATTERNING FACTOR-like protein 2 [Panicum miliaceum]|uniref:Epidermal patterning factor-like protein n=1 Tax=Panicum miliaceum TaxID=4540 RepID=A0A3L6R8E4_PANMI|nr:EPIDERMAL PATTERNING FACTOR-like protein 2 [Panicum miliaceum]